MTHLTTRNLHARMALIRNIGRCPGEPMRDRALIRARARLVYTRFGA